MSYLLSNNFNIGFYGRKFSVQEIVSLDLIAKSSIGLARGGQMNLCVITEVTLMQFYNLHNNLMI